MVVVVEVALIGDDQLHQWATGTNDEAEAVEVAVMAA